MVTPAVKREAVAHLKGAHGMSERRACMAIACDRMTVRYRSRRPDDRVLRERLRALARERRRFGYRRLLIFLRREGFGVNHKRLFRIYREERPVSPTATTIEPKWRAMLPTIATAGLLGPSKKGMGNGFDCLFFGFQTFVFRRREA